MRSSGSNGTMTGAGVWLAFAGFALGLMGSVAARSDGLGERPGAKPAHGPTCLTTEDMPLSERTRTVSTAMEASARDRPAGCAPRLFSL